MFYFNKNINKIIMNSIKESYSLKFYKASIFISSFTTK